MPDIDKIVRRPANYLAETGVPQLTSGLVFSVLGLATLVRTASLHNFALEESIQWGGIAMCIAVFWWSKRLMQHSIAPRGGYVAVERPRAHRIMLWASFALSGIMAVLAIAGYGPPRLDGRLVWPGFALAFAWISTWTGWKQKSSPALLYGIYLLMLALVLWWLPMDNYGRSGAMQLAAGVPFAAYGLLRVRKFLRQNPVVDSTNE